MGDAPDGRGALRARSFAPSMTAPEPTSEHVVVGVDGSAGSVEASRRATAARTGRHAGREVGRPRSPGGVTARRRRRLPADGQALVGDVAGIAHAGAAPGAHRPPTQGEGASPSGARSRGGSRAALRPPLRTQEAVGALLDATPT